MRRALPLLLAGSLVLISGCPSDEGLKVYNSEPEAAILQPVDGAEFPESDVVHFEGRVADDSGFTLLDVQWISDIDGLLTDNSPPDANGRLSYTSGNLTPGNHVITLTVVDAAGKRGTDEITVTVIDLPEPPSVEIIHPASGESGTEGVPFEFVAVVLDSQDAPQDLEVGVYSSLDGFLCGAIPDGLGAAKCYADLSSGDHLITIEGVDQDGNLNQATAYMAVTSTLDVDNDLDGWTEIQGDCDDTDPSVNPGGAEVYNGIDDNCNAIIDEGTVGYDDDGDGYSEVDGDCDDGNALSFPFAFEVEDGQDNNCDGSVDEGTSAYDDDGDGYSENQGDCNDASYEISPSAVEMCDLIDNDCDGLSDEANAWDCTTYYEDWDADNFGDANSSACLCAATAAFSSSNYQDCYDDNDDVYPSQTSYFGVQRGDGSYDYNCDSTQTKRYTNSHSCTWNVVSCATSAGWQGSVPQCGSQATWVNDCTWDWGGCQVQTSSRTQTCK